MTRMTRTPTMMTNAMITVTTSMRSAGIVSDLVTRG